jgi:hypothetical protein
VLREEELQRFLQVLRTIVNAQMTIKNEIHGLLVSLGAKDTKTSLIKHTRAMNDIRRLGDDKEYASYIEMARKTSRIVGGMLMQGNSILGLYMIRILSGKLH